MEALPLIRYRTGDHTRILPGPCPCGSETLRLDRLRRMDDGGMAALDDALFALPELVDHAAVREDGVLSLRALTLGGGCADGIREKAAALFPEAKLRISVTPAGADDRALYRGKRTLSGRKRA